MEVKDLLSKLEFCRLQVIIFYLLMLITLLKLSVLKIFIIKSKLLLVKEKELRLVRGIIVIRKLLNKETF